MKFIRLASIFIAILAILIISLPASAAPTTVTLTYNQVNGIEISAGSFNNGVTYGATFTAVATDTKSHNSGVLVTSVNYQGTVPTVANGSNIITGGTWSLSSFQGTISGEIKGGIINWQSYNGMENTGLGVANINLRITKGTGKFSGIKKSSSYGSFEGCDVHASGVFVKLGNTQIQVPIIKVISESPYNQKGLTLVLNYN
jgi:hypothetical protein